ARAAEGAGKDPDGASGRPDRPADLSPELQQKFVKKGLEAYYRDSSAQTKAELAPFMEELQKSMESGRLFRR
ncbi:MAG TPA: hypothetical protein VK968_05650, partial [Roseimicrobium sp.]|nr:hypothetical protein [Roseimicrobium sp.]